MNAPAAASAAITPAANISLVASPSLTVEVAFDGRELRASIVESSRDAIEVIEQLHPAQRARLVETGWTIGLRAAMNAHRLASESRLEDIGHDLLDTFREQLVAHQQSQQEAISRVLADYFDPKDGRVPGRIEAFIRDGGELARTMDKYLAGDGELAKTLARSFGEASPLMKRLSPTDSEGVVQLFESKLRAALELQQASFATALDPATENGALARFFTKLKTDLKAAGEDRDRQLAVISKTLDANDKTSAMSRFFSESRSAHKSLLQAMNAEDPATPLGSIKCALTKLLEKHAKQQQEVLAVIDERQRKDSLELREAITKLEVRRRVEARSAAGGATFEDALVSTVSGVVRGAPVTVEPTGLTVGLRPNCKKGDVVVRYSAEHKHAGAAVVIEAKHDASYTVPRALAELETARANRDASAGLFVMARTHAPVGFPRFQRYGADILIIWDDGDPDSDIILELALSMALFMAPLGRRDTADREDIEALRDLESRIETELKRCERLRKKADSLRADADDIADEVRKGEKALTHMLKSARRTLGALDLPLLDAYTSGQPTLALPGLERSDAAE